MLKALLKKFLLDVTDVLAVLGVRHPAGGAILLVRLDAMGDFTLWLPAARALREHYAGRRIILLANAAFSEFAKALPYWDEVWPADLKLLGRPGPYRWKLWRSVRRYGFSLALQPTVSRVYGTGDSAVRASGAAERIGSMGDLSNSSARQKARSDAWYTRLLPFGRRRTGENELQYSERHASELEADFLFALAGIRPRAGATVPVLTVAHPSRLPPAPTGYFLVAPAAGGPGRCWPPDRFAAVSDRVVREHGLVSVLVGGKSERGICGAVLGFCRENAVDISGQTEASELVELVRGSRFVLGNDSAPVHIAAALGTPSVAVLGGGHFGRFMPYPKGASPCDPIALFEAMPCYHCDWRCTQPHENGGPFPCVRSVRTENVYSAVEGLLATPQK